ncbi:TRAP transporter substrate-binding protein [Zobellella taiwanensis]|uniref:ABC transporter substrate-binding protein n=1 Tax=Zobellella taiwanensis TaxID=347535 RepID=A0A2P7R1U7_9GAMM|nr:TRAP transporter substrate-binding protein [Zobellella taiwanensis]PSJ44193.1 ABC transporter substrate-binding protein [Zobellella taiwanensis]
MKAFKTTVTSAIALCLMMSSSMATAEITARMGTSLPDSHPQTLGAQYFSKLVNEKSDGEITIQVFSNGILGNDVNMTSMLQSGTLQFTVPSTATLASLNSDFSIISLPFQFSNEAQADEVLDGDVGKSLLDSLNNKGLSALAFWENGFRHITNSRRPINSLDDLKGLKIRTMQNDLYIGLFNGLNANAVPMPVTELFTALETHTVDGQENPYTVINTARFFEVQKYLSRTAHAYDALVLLASKPFMDSLNETQRQIIHEAAQEATTYQRAESRRLNNELLAELEKKMEINEVSEDERDRMGSSLQPLIERYQNELDSGLVEDFKQALATAKNRN